MMAGGKLTYSQTIFVVKIVLPAVAILLIVGVFALSRGQPDQSRLPFSLRDISERLTEQSIAKPLYIGSTHNGIEVRVSAERLVPAQGDQQITSFHIVRAEFIDDQIPIGTITAKKALLDTKTEFVEFIGNVVATDNDNRRVTSNRLLTNSDMTNSDFEGNVRLSQEKNFIIADRLKVSSQTSTSPRRFVFTENVKLLYIPE